MIFILKIWGIDKLVFERNRFLEKFIHQYNILEMEMTLQSEIVYTLKNNQVENEYIGFIIYYNYPQLRIIKIMFVSDYKRKTFLLNYKTSMHKSLIQYILCSYKTEKGLYNDVEFNDVYMKKYLYNHFEYEID